MMRYLKIIIYLILNCLLFVRGNAQVDSNAAYENIFIEEQESREVIKKGLRRIEEIHIEMDNEILFSKGGAIQFEDFELSISSQGVDQGIEIYYTLDASIPTTSSSLYQEAIDVRNPIDDKGSYAVVVRAAGFIAGERVTNIKSASYVFYKHKDEKYKLPVVSLITDSENFYNHDTGIYVKGVNYTGDLWSGNYFQTGIDWERDIHITYFDEHGVQQLEQDAGVRIHGGLQRTSEQKSFRFYARSEYGDKDFDYQLLPQKEKNEYKRFILRTTTGEWKDTFIKDAVSVDLVRGLNLEMQDYRPVIALLNGESFGIYWVRDYLGGKHFEDKYDVEEESLDVVVGASGNEASIGTNTDYQELRTFFREQDVAVQEHYEYVKTKMDIYDYINYYASEIYLNNYDWPAGNGRSWKSSDLDDKWRWMFYDLDATFDNGRGVDYNLLNQASTDSAGWPNPPGTSLIFASLLENLSFRDEFITRSAYIAHYHFSPNKALDVIENVKSQVLPEINFQIEKWGNPISLSGMNSAINSNLIGFSEVRNGYVQSHYTTKFQLSGISELTLQANYDHGKITLNDLPIPEDDNSADYYRDVVIRLEAIPNYGYVFDYWAGGVQDSTQSYIEIILEDDLVLTAIFVVDETVPNVRINELKTCGEGDESDWVELLNYGPNLPDLNDWFLSDDQKELDKWSLLNVGDRSFEEKDFLFLEVNVDDSIIDLSKLNFKIASGETIYLSTSRSGELIVADQMFVQSAPCHLSLGVFNDESDRRLIPTPGIANELYEIEKEVVEGVYLNELLASNDDVVKDEFDEYEDWIELYNGNDKAINVNGLFLSDDQKDPFKYQIELLDAEINSHGHKLFWADDNVDQGESHLNFKLSKSGECIYLNQLTDVSFVVLDSICFNTQSVDVSFGREEDGQLPWVYFIEPTPNAENGPVAGVDYDLTLSFELYPNPFSEETIIRSELVSEVIDVHFWNIQGQKLSVNWNNNGEQIKVQRGDLEEGLYIYQLLDKNAIVNQGKVLIQN